MTRSTLVCLCVLASGCNELLDTGRYFVADGSVSVDTGVDSGPGPIDAAIDSGVDGCVEQTFYRDRDMDTYGDPDDAVTNCVAPMGYVARADDCDDDAMGTNPDATETCNDGDDDCDGAVDEGLMEPIGTPVEIARQSCCLPFQASAAVSTAETLVVYRRSVDERLYYRRVPWMGVPEAEASIGPPASGTSQSEPVAWLHTSELAGATYFVGWEETTALRGTFIPVGSGSGLMPFVFSDAGDVANILVASLGERVVTAWLPTGSASLFARRINPIAGVPDGPPGELPITALPGDITLASALVPVLAPAGDLALLFSVFGTGDPPRSGSFGGVLDSATLAWTANPSRPSSEPLSPVVGVFAASDGQPRDRLPVVVFDSFDPSADSCVGELNVASDPFGYGATCESFPATPLGVAARTGSLALLVLRGTDTVGFLERPLTAGTTISPIRDITSAADARDSARIAAHGSRISVTYQVREPSGGGTNDLVLFLQQVGCTP